MVTAIVIPIICIYFYWLTRKEMKEHREKWQQLAHVREESIVTGIIKEIREEKQRYYYHYFIHVYEMKIENDYKSFKVKKIYPVKKEMAPFYYQTGDEVHLYGKWEESYFRINRIVKQKDENIS